MEGLIDELTHAADEARSVSTEPRGTLKLTASVAFGQVRLLPPLPAFRAAYPGVSLDLQFKGRRGLSETSPGRVQGSDLDL